jgi:hypothetical protein
MTSANAINALATAGAVVQDYADRPRGMDGKAYRAVNAVLGRLYPRLVAGQADPVEAAKTALGAVNALQPPHNSLDRLRLRRALAVLEAVAGGRDATVAAGLLTRLQRGVV